MIGSLFSCYLDSEVKMKEHYLPMLTTIATFEFGKRVWVDGCLFLKLLEKEPENGAAIVAEHFQDKPEVGAQDCLFHCFTKRIIVLCAACKFLIVGVY